MGIHATWDPEKGVGLSMTVGAVLDPMRLNGYNSMDWTFESLFGRNVQKLCAVTSEATVKLSQVRSIGHADIEPRPTAIDRAKGVAWEIWYIGNDGLNVTAKYPKEFTYREWLLARLECSNVFRCFSVV